MQETFLGFAFFLGEQNFWVGTLTVAQMWKPAVVLLSSGIVTEQLQTPCSGFLLNHTCMNWTESLSSFCLFGFHADMPQATLDTSISDCTEKTFPFLVSPWSICFPFPIAAGVTSFASVCWKTNLKETPWTSSARSFDQLSRAWIYQKQNAKKVLARHNLTEKNKKVTNHLRKTFVHEWMHKKHLMNQATSRQRQTPQNSILLELLKNIRKHQQLSVLSLLRSRFKICQKESDSSNRNGRELFCVHGSQKRFLFFILIHRGVFPECFCGWGFNVFLFGNNFLSSALLRLLFQLLSFLFDKSKKYPLVLSGLQLDFRVMTESEMRTATGIKMCRPCCRLLRKPKCTCYTTSVLISM